MLQPQLSGTQPRYIIALSDTLALALTDWCRNEAFQRVPCVTAGWHTPRLSMLCRYPGQHSWTILGEFSRNQRLALEGTGDEVCRSRTAHDTGVQAFKLPAKNASNWIRTRKCSN